MNSRFYDPETGRFLSQDTYTGNPYDPWAQHLYSYCGNNPINYKDPTGHRWDDVIWGNHVTSSDTHPVSMGGLHLYESKNEQWLKLGDLSRLEKPDSEIWCTYYDGGEYHVQADDKATRVLLDIAGIAPFGTEIVKGGVELLDGIEFITEAELDMGNLLDTYSLYNMQAMIR